MNDPVAAVVNLVAVLVNGEAHMVPAGCTLADLIERLGHLPEGVATAVNGRFVARAQRAGRALAAGDQVNCFQAIVGG